MEASGCILAKQLKEIHKEVKKLTGRYRSRGFMEGGKGPMNGSLGNRFYKNVRKT